jgi:hypothetical protein
MENINEIDLSSTGKARIRFIMAPAMLGTHTSNGGLLEGEKRTF